MEIKLPRIGHVPVTSTPTGTLGTMSIDGVFKAFTIEDIHRDVKVNGETRIPAGRYQIKFREVLSGMTKSYRAKYPWFTWHLELQDVPNFNYVYIHIGNSSKNSEGCILVATTATWDKDFIGSSGPRFEAIYKEISAALNSGEEVWITIED